MKTLPMSSFWGGTNGFGVPFRAYDPATEVCQGMLPATLSHFGLTGVRRLLTSGGDVMKKLVTC